MTEGPDATELEPTLREPNGAPETIYLHGYRAGPQTTSDGWVVSSDDSGSWRPLVVGDRVVALDLQSPAEFLVEVTEVDQIGGDVFYRVAHLADLDPAAEPGLDNTRTWLRPS